MNKVLEYIISAKDKTGGAIKSAMRRVGDFAKNAMTQMANIKAGFDMALNAIRVAANAVATVIGEAFKFEKATADFKVLLGTMEDARQHIADLRQFAASTPLGFEDLSKASKLLLSFGASVDSIMPNLKMLGDISLGDAQKFQGLALVFAQVQSAGKLMGQDLLQMINQGFNPLTIIAEQTGQSVAELKDLMSEGGISFEMVAEAMRVATSEGGLFHGAMEEAAKTGEGMISTMKDNWTEVVRTFGEAFTDTAKDGVGELSDAMKELTENGTITEWATEVAKALQYVVDGFSAIGKSVSWLYAKSGAKDIWNYTQGSFRGIGDAIGAVSGTLDGGGSVWQAIKEGGKGFVGGLRDELGEDGHYWRIFGTAQPGPEEPVTVATIEPEEEKVEEPAPEIPRKTLAEMFEEARAAKTEEDAQKAAEAEAKKAAQLAEKEAAAKLKAEEKAAVELAMAEERERLAVERRIAEEKARLQKDLLADYAAGLSEAQTREAAAQARLQRAVSAEQQAWGWYRDRDAWNAQLAEEEAEETAQKQFDKDFERLKFRHRDWRTADLAGDDELIKRVALAREEKAAAEEWAKMTAEASSRAAQLLESINEAITEAE